MSQLPVTAIEIADYTGILVGAAIALNALEQLLFVRAGTGDLFSRWELLKLRFKATSGWFGQILGILFENGRFSGVLVFRLGTGALMVLCWYTGEFRSLSAGLVVIANSLFLLRSPYGTDGADQMMQIICVALFIGSIAGTDIGIKGALWFIAAQSVLSYFVSGFAKISSNTWRSGRALDGIFKTRMYGDQWFDNYLSKKNGRAVLASWAVILCQLSAPVWIFLGTDGAVAYIILFGTFHILNAIFMGLPWFVVSFPIAYPAIYYVAATL